MKVSPLPVSAVSPPQASAASTQQASVRAADGDYKTKGIGHEVKDADGDYKPTKPTVSSAPASAPSASLQTALLGLTKGGS